MRRSPYSSCFKASRQHGSTLIVFMLIFFLAAVSLFLSRVDSSRMRNEANKITNAALAKAKDALIGRAASDKERPGSLPCPDFNDDGEATNGSCYGVPGRLPWKTLNLPDLRDGDGNRLWYVLSSELRDNGTIAINTNLSLSLSLDDKANIAAIIFSPGPPLTDQSNRPSNIVADYLDGANKTGGPYISGPTTASFNDKTIAVSHDQLFGIVNRAIVGLLSAGLEKFYVANANLYPENGANLIHELSSLIPSGSDEQTEEQIALRNTIEMLEKNAWLTITNYSPAPDRKSATLTITASPAITCTIIPKQKPVCAQP